MTEQQISYVDGFTSQAYYEKAGAFRGSAGRGFLISVLIRDSRNFVGLGGAGPRFIVGNIESDFTAGWGVQVSPSTILAFIGGASVAVPVSVGSPANMVANRAMLVVLGFGLEDDATEPGNWSASWINGNFFSRFGPSSSDYAPPAADAPFRVGLGNTTNGEITPFDDGGVGGFSFRDGLPDEGSGDNFDAVDAIARAQWNTVVETGDLSDDDDLGEVFSARRGAANAPATWTGSQGTVLDRVGAPTASSFHDRFYGGDPLL